MLQFLLQSQGTALLLPVPAKNMDQEGQNFADFLATTSTDEDDASVDFAAPPDEEIQTETTPLKADPIKADEATQPTPDFANLDTNIDTKRINAPKLESPIGSDSQPLNGAPKTQATITNVPDDSSQSKQVAQTSAPVGRTLPEAPLLKMGAEVADVDAKKQVLPGQTLVSNDLSSPVRVENSIAITPAISPLIAQGVQIRQPVDVMPPRPDVNQQTIAPTPIRLAQPETLIAEATRSPDRPAAPQAVQQTQSDAMQLAPYPMPRDAIAPQPAEHPKAVSPIEDAAFTPKPLLTQPSNGAPLPTVEGAKDRLPIKSGNRPDDVRIARDAPPSASAPSITENKLAATVPMVAPVPMAVTLAKDPDVNFGPAEGEDLGLRATTPQSTTSHPVTPSTGYTRAQAAQISPQIVAAVSQSAAGTTEIALNPEELGRVRITLTSNEAGLSVTIIAERPETADLMRRHLDVLAREFREMGHQDATFSFDDDQGNGADQDTPQGQHFSDPLGEHIPTTPTPMPTLLSLSSGLDLKL